LQSDQVGKDLTFHLGREDFGIPNHHMTEIIGIQSITQVPDMPFHPRGVINLRGKGRGVHP
jgi:purine-binding chemotaxis protein CheW